MALNTTSLLYHLNLRLLLRLRHIPDHADPSQLDTSGAVVPNLSQQTMVTVLPEPVTVRVKEKWLSRFFHSLIEQQSLAETSEIPETPGTSKRQPWLLSRKWLLIAGIITL